VEQNTSYISCTAGQSEQKGGRVVFEKLIWGKKKEKRKKEKKKRHFFPNITRITTFSSAAITRDD